MNLVRDNHGEIVLFQCTGNLFKRVDAKKKIGVRAVACMYIPCQTTERTPRDMTLDSRTRNRTKIR